MICNFTLEYWMDDGWFVGRIKDVPGVFSQGETLSDLEENIRDAYQLMTEKKADFTIRQTLCPPEEELKQ